MKKFLKVFVIIITLFVLVAAGGYIYLKSLPMPTVDISAVDLSGIRDGSYTGEYQSFPVRVIVKVDVTDHKITSIEIIKHENGMGKKAEEITKEIVRAQSLDVDTVSGATLSSEVILGAVKAALEKGR